MKYISFQKLLPCMAVALVVMSTASTRGQAPVHMEQATMDPVLADPVLADPVLTNSVHLDQAHSTSNSVVSSDTSSSGTYVGDISWDGGGTINGRCYNQPDLFYNYYTEGLVNRANAQMYLCPLPIPPNVGHTFYTYQPFYPHEMLYKHTNKFHSCYDKGRGMNQTRVSYCYPPVHQAISNLYWNKLRCPR